MYQIRMFFKGALHYTGNVIWKDFENFLSTYFKLLTKLPYSVFPTSVSLAKKNNRRN